MQVILCIREKKNFKAIRSFIVAHPLNTDRHTEFGYDGKKECIDIKLKLSEVEEAFSDYDRRNADFYLSYYDNDKSYAYKNEGHGTTIFIIQTALGKF